MGAYQFTQAAISHLEKQIVALGQLPFVGFTHDVTNMACRHGMLTTSHAVSELYQSDKLTLNCVDEHGRRLMPSGFHTTNMLHHRYRGSLPTEYLFSQALNATHHLHCLLKEGEIEHLLTWSFHCDNSAFEATLLNERDTFEGFIERHFAENDELICDAMAVQNSLSFESRVPKIDALHPPKFVNNKTKQPLLLTDKQAICLEFALQGLTAKEIAREVDSSYRTVQHHLHAIKTRNGIDSMKTLLRYVDVR